MSLICLCPQQEDCEKAYFKMDNVLIDDRRIHVDFSQSVAKIKWKGKGADSPTFHTLRFTSCPPPHHLLVGLSPGGKYTKDDFKAYEKDVENRTKLALKDHVKPKQEYPSAVIRLGVGVLMLVETLP